MKHRLEQKFLQTDQFNIIAVLKLDLATGFDSFVITNTTLTRTLPFEMFVLWLQKYSVECQPFNDISIYLPPQLTYPPISPDKRAISQTMFSDAFSRMKSFTFW